MAVILMMIIVKVNETDGACGGLGDSVSRVHLAGGGVLIGSWDFPLCDWSTPIA